MISARRTRSVLCLFLAASATLLPVGCDRVYFWHTQTCTLVGCGSGPRVVVGELANLGFRASVDTDQGGGGFRCDPPTGDGDEQVFHPTPTEVSGVFSGADPDLYPSCTGEGFELAHRRGAMPPSRLDFTATALEGEASVSGSFDDIAYQLSQPNGPDCEPTCYNATLPPAAE